MFLNATMLAGIAGAALPLVVHLLSRSRVRTVDWGAMMFLSDDRGSQDRAARLKQWTLLLLRMGIVALLAIALARLQHDRHEVIVLRVLDPDETTFPFRRWARFRGLEGERPQVCEPALVRKRYLAQFRAHADGLAGACRALRCEMHTFTTDRPLDQTLTGFLQHRHALVPSPAGRSLG